MPAKMPALQGVSHVFCARLAAACGIEGFPVVFLVLEPGAWHGCGSIAIVTSPAFISRIREARGMTRETSEFVEFESDKLILRLDVAFAARVEEVAPVVQRILDIAGEIGCVAGKEFEVQLALHEALANAVIHGCKRDANKRVQVTACCDRSRGMLIIVRDPGSGFDVNSLTSPLMGERVFMSHGRGIFMISQLMDQVHFARGGTEIRMLKK
jgi:anti-sigma regulatory factor (Ser/Thr protein kinase)